MNCFQRSYNIVDAIEPGDNVNVRVWVALVLALLAIVQEVATLAEELRAVREA